ncbi:lysozyme [Coprinopsis cinerea okayama7|uniref:Lysozyme n=1 Tax=Coprinopsis cinerea (strain Okayama-7 / 130 / ATCC MYA-4618 / FGSC 9003) TaxID=240176 RepID=A8PEP4_COPC7|nr:lysozyme [Coprinopsis cinerea okayama7\|eukprot:XP_001840813.1 lysozyme [Coprinopsis cinerea okayama7\
MKPVALFSTIVLALSATVQGAINDPCSVNGKPGVCVTTSACSSAGGISTAGFCPNDPANVRCCTKSCSSGGLCPGPSNFKCCLPASSTCAGTNVNSKTVEHIKQWEGFVKSPAPDPIGLPTVGYGHLCKTKGCSEVPYKFPLTEAQATSLLKTDLKTFQNCISSQLKDSVRLNANQYGALVSWAFNVGCGNTSGSALISRLNKGESPNTVASQELPKWNKAGGKVLQGLVNRRKAEVTLFKTSSSVIHHPPTCTCTNCPKPV